MNLPRNRPAVHLEEPMNGGGNRAMAPEDLPATAKSSVLPTPPDMLFP
jgi:hypothetical protein